ncbi:helix-turn-helix domain-containing protein [Aurantibacter crassamenti]|uniref:AraC family transcriptional regulator n=1 Tax=Aurantibacter crassamenti TaxID=1837375 RepID=UPI00193AA49C|nr:AraC family transcriptional regulator [Aurantibacter crassamenti]MBM1105054.1 helix-turn-helix domain-containing protein [Aurantibacter crassamenti]
METTEIRLFKESNQSFIYHIENKDFGIYHHHPEYELVYIKKGSGVRIVGDNISEFKENDLVFLGSYLPHVWRCDSSHSHADGTFTGKGYVIQFLEEFLGNPFLQAPENRGLSSFLSKTFRGCKFYGETKDKLINIILDMQSMNPTARLYALFSILEVLATTEEFEFICSPAFYIMNKTSKSSPLHNVVEFILDNFKENIKLKDVLEISNMSNTQFFLAFKKTYRMPFKSYLLKLRVGYACRLLADPTRNISQIAYESGFENLSNFNRHFKSINDCTPTAYRKKLERKLTAKISN